MDIFGINMIQDGSFAVFKTKGKIVPNHDELKFFYYLNATLLAKLMHSEPLTNLSS